MTFRITENISKSITCNFCCLWKSVEEMPSRIVGFGDDNIEDLALVAGWSTAIVGPEAIRSTDVLNICPICKERAPQDLARYFNTRKSDLDSAKERLGLKVENGKELLPQPDSSGCILHPTLGEGGPW